MAPCPRAAPCRAAKFEKFWIKLIIANKTKTERHDYDKTHTAYEMLRWRHVRRLGAKPACTPRNTS
eukprot:scaffold34797_cov65-Phaeocystis_antarctica.AAC.2